MMVSQSECWWPFLGVRLAEWVTCLQSEWRWVVEVACSDSHDVPSFVRNCGFSRGFVGFVLGRLMLVQTLVGVSRIGTGSGLVM